MAGYSNISLWISLQQGVHYLTKDLSRQRRLDLLLRLGGHDAQHQMPDLLEQLNHLYRRLGELFTWMFNVSVLTGRLSPIGNTVVTMMTSHGIRCHQER